MKVYEKAPKIETYDLVSERNLVYVCEATKYLRLAARRGLHEQITYNMKTQELTTRTLTEGSYVLFNRPEMVDVGDFYAPVTPQRLANMIRDVVKFYKEYPELNKEQDFYH